MKTTLQASHRKSRIHRLRIAVKRLRSHWRLCREAGITVDARFEMKSLRKAGRLLGPARDQQVLPHCLLGVLGAISGPFVAKLRRECIAYQPTGVMLRVERILERSLKKSHSIAGIGKGDAPWETAFHRTFNRARAKMPKSTHASDGEFHAWRKAVKNLLYPLEEISSGKSTHKLVIRLDRIQNRLGKLHDLELIRK